MSDATTALRKFKQAVQDTQGDFAKMPFFVRPMVRKLLLRRTGLNEKAWLALAQELETKLEKGESMADIASATPGLRAQLESLSRYYSESPARAARGMGMGRIPSILEKVKRAAAERESAVQAVLLLLEGS